MSVSRLLTETSSMELTKWMVYFKVRAAQDEQRRRDAEFERSLG